MFQIATLNGNNNTEANKLVYIAIIIWQLIKKQVVYSNKYLY